VRRTGTATDVAPPLSYKQWSIIMAKRAVQTDATFDGLSGVLTGAGVKLQAMTHARRLFDEALADVGSFEEALAHVLNEGFRLGQSAKPRRKRAPKANGDAPPEEF
jgi:hypothetical protein